MTSSFKSKDDRLTAVQGEVYSYEGATLKATTPLPGTNDKTVPTTEWVNNTLGIVPSPPTVLSAGGLNISYTSGTIINPLTGASVYIAGSNTPVAVGDNSTEYVWVRYLDEAVIATSTTPSNNQGYLLATVNTNNTGITGITGNTNAAGWAPINNPAFSGTVTVPSPPPTDNSNRAASTSWVRSQIQTTLVGSNFPTISINSAGNGISWSTGSVTIGGDLYQVLGGQYTFFPSTTGMISIYAVLVTTVTVVTVSLSPPTGPNVLLGTVSVNGGAVGQVDLPPILGFAPINSPTFMGTPHAPTPPLSSKSGVLATTEWVVDMIQTKMAVGFGGYVTYIP